MKTTPWRTITNWLKARATRWMATTLGLATLAAATVGGLLLSRPALARPVTPVSATVAVQGTSISTANVRTSETEAGNLVADAVRAGADGAEIAFVYAAAFRPGVEVPRPANADQAVSLVDPQSDGVVVMALQGDQIKAALERSVSFAPQPSSGFLQVSSGLRFTFDGKRDAGRRILSVTVNGQPLESARTYKVATTRPLAKGQQGYFQIWKESDIASDTGKTVGGLVAAYVKAQGGSVSPSVDGRIGSGG